MPNGVTAKFYQIFRKELISVLLKHSQNIEEEGTLPNAFYEASITLIINPHKDITQQKRNYRSISPMSMNVGTSNKILAA